MPIHFLNMHVLLMSDTCSIDSNRTFPPSSFHCISCDMVLSDPSFISQILAVYMPHPLCAYIVAAKTGYYILLIAVFILI